MIETLALIVAAFLTSMLSAVIGMGGGITLLGIMALIMPDGYLVVAYHGIVQLASNATRTFVYRDHLHRPILRRFLIGLITGLALSVAIIYLLIYYFQVSSASEIKIDFLKPLIGFYIIWFLYFRKKRKPVAEKAFLWMGSIGGLATVFIGAMGPLIAPLFINNKLTKENIIATKAACQTAGHLLKIPIFIFLFGVSYISNWSIIFPLVIAVYLGTNFGKKMLGMLPEKMFHFFFKIALTIIAIRLITLSM